MIVLIDCFVAGTMIASSVGLVPIEDIKSGDMVYAHDPETGETALKEVVQTFRNEANELVHVTVNGEEIICTPTHPFYVPVKGWTAACELRAGDRLQLVNGEYVVVEQVQHEILEFSVTVYNFEVEDFHTYYVGDTGVLVHNKCGGDEWSTIRESSTAVNKTKGMSVSQYRNYENTLTKLSKGDMSGLNIHVSKGGYFSADIPGFGKGRGNGRILYDIKDGIIDVIDITLKHFK